MIKPALFDCDVHHNWKSESDVLQYLPHRWRDTIHSISPPMLWLQQSYGTNARIDSYDRDGSLPGSSYEILKSQYLDLYNVKKAKLSFYIGQNGGLANPYAADALIRAINDWNREHWLSIEDDRLISVILISTQNPEEAAKEIRRVAYYPKIVEILLVPNPIGKPFGHPIYHPIYEAAVEVGLPIAIHIGGEGFVRPMLHIAGGHANCKLDYLTLQTQPMIHHLVSFITHGVFEKYPSLKLLLIEMGLAWLPSFVWKLDSMVDILRLETDWVKQLPSDYLRQHVRLTTQPMEPGPSRKHMIDQLEMFEGIEDMLCYASDYPHWDSDDPLVIAARIPKDWHAKLFYNNSAKLYNFPELSEQEISGAAATRAIHGEPANG
jgi:predicted TIM-barrel fold metal-dependent hydrolase